MTSCRWTAVVDDEENGCQPRVDLSAPGNGWFASVRVRMADPDRRAGFEEWLIGQFDVVEAFHCAGNFDYELRLNCGDPTRLTARIAAIRHAGGAIEVETTVLLDRIEPSRPAY